jgi:dsRNA-specific ribonuclease
MSKQNPFPTEYFGEWNNVQSDYYVPDVVAGRINTLDMLDVPNCSSCHVFNADEEFDVMNKNHVLMYGRNFEDRVSKRCIKSKDAKEMMNKVVLAMATTLNTSFLAIEINTGYTGSTQEILSHPAFDMCISYALDTNTLNMLRRNINYYKLGAKSITADRYDGTAIKKELTGCIVFVHNLIVSDQMAYIDEHLTITLNDYIEMCISTVHILVIQHSVSSLPTGWKHMGGTNTHTILLNDSGRVDPAATRGGLVKLTQASVKKLITSAISIPPFVSSLYETRGEKHSDTIPINASNLTKLFMDRRSKSSWTSLANALPRKPASVKVGSAEWFDQIRDYLQIFLSHLTKGDSEVEKMIGAMTTNDVIRKYWLRALVHESANAETNYERFETFGDEFLNSAFFAYTAERHPKMTSSEFTSLKHHYLSVDHQPVMARALKLDSWIVSNITVGHKMLEDVFESFTGALYFAAEDAKRCFGLTFVKLFVSIIFDDIDLYGDDDAHLGNKKMMIDTIAVGLGVPKLTDDYTSMVKGQYTFKSSIRSATIEAIKNKGLSIPSIASLTVFGQGNTLAEAELNARTKLYKGLKAVGVTLAWIKEKNSKKKEQHNQVLTDLFQRCRLKARGKGMADIFVNKYETKSLIKAASLVGVMSDGKKVNLAFVEMTVTGDIGGSSKDNLLFSQLYNKFLSK